MKKLDLTNQRFGLLTVIKPAPKRNDKYTRWICKCDCGKITEVRTDYLRNGHTTSCGCVKQKHFQKYDLKGQRFGKLTVLQDLPPNKQRCQCDCGNLIDVLTSNLINGNTSSCGCWQKEQSSKANFISLVGQRFGKLLVLERVDNKFYNAVCYKCQCDCGAITFVTANNLKNGNTNSCGCIKSKGEMLINKWLQEHNINFKSQFSHPDIILESKRHPFFDFAIFDNKNNLLFFIEYNGKQHYQVTGGWNTPEVFKITQNRDNQKRAWCKKLNIPLYEIAYNENLENKLNQIFFKEELFNGKLAQELVEEAQ